jgi:hypothetical protein
LLACLFPVHLIPQLLHASAGQIFPQHRVEIPSESGSYGRSRLIALIAAWPRWHPNQRRIGALIAQCVGRQPEFCSPLAGNDPPPPLFTA